MVRSQLCQTVKSHVFSSTLESAHGTLCSVDSSQAGIESKLQKIADPRKVSVNNNTLISRGMPAQPSSEQSRKPACLSLKQDSHKNIVTEKATSIKANVNNAAFGKAKASNGKVYTVSQLKQNSKAITKR